MATRKKAPAIEPKQPLELAVSREEARSKIEDRMQKGRDLRLSQISTQAAYDEAMNSYSKWNAFNNELLKRLFTTEEISEEYSSWVGGFISIGGRSLGQKISELYEDIDAKVHRLDSISERLELIPLCSSQANVDARPEIRESQEKNKKVFVVHGHDEVAKTNLEVFLREIGLDPIVLHRQADEGMTIIEKFEKHSDVGYAFILLTPDEIAYLAGEEGKPDQERAKQLRARPNVIFEFGYFVGKLGRSKVCCLYTGNVTLPSDVSGMIYKQYAASIEEVAYSVIKDLKAQGFKVA